MATINVNIDAMRESATRIDEARQGIEGVRDGFISSIENMGDPFGGDMIGMLLGIAHQAVVSAVGQCFESNITELEPYSEGIRTMADGYEQTEQDITAEFDKFSAG
jgi:uncharacterized protein YukE